MTLNKRYQHFYHNVGGNDAERSQRFLDQVKILMEERLAETSADAGWLHAEVESLTYPEDDENKIRLIVRLVADDDAELVKKPDWNNLVAQLRYVQKNFVADENKDPAPEPADQPTEDTAAPEPTEPTEPTEDTAKDTGAGLGEDPKEDPTDVEDVEEVDSEDARARELYNRLRERKQLPPVTQEPPAPSAVEPAPTHEPPAREKGPNLLNVAVAGLSLGGLFWAITDML